MFKLQIIFFLLTCLVASFLFAEVTLVESSNSGCLVAFQESNYSIDTLHIQNQNYHRLNSISTTSWGEPGDPAMLQASVLIGIPQRGSVQIALNDAQFNTKSSVLIMPVPETRMQDGLSRNIFSQGDLYTSNTLYPNQLFELSEPEMFGNQRVVKLTFYPVQTILKDHQVRLYSTIKVRLNFEQPGELTSASYIRENEIQKYAILNYTQAKSWQFNPSKGIRKQNITQSGSWYKIPVSGTEEGIYQIKGSWLDDKGIDISSIDPTTLKIYNHGGKMLSESLSDIPESGWIENPVYVSDGSDGSFDDQDYLLFYGRGTQNAEFQTGGDLIHYTHLYSNDNIYFLVFNDGITGKRIESDNSAPSGNLTSIDSFRDLYFYEEDKVNLVVGGKSWVGNTFTPGTASYTIITPYSNAISSSDATFSFRFYGGTSEYHGFQIFNDATLVGTLYRNGKGYITREYTYSGLNLNEESELNIQYTSTADNAKAYLDWVRISYERELEAVENELKFYSPVSDGNYQMNLSGFTQTPTVWDISDIHDIKIVSLTSQGNNYLFNTAVVEDPKTFYAFTSSNYKTPSQITSDETSTLRNTSNGADYLIITHSDFIDEVQVLKAHRESHDGFSVYVTDVQDVFDEFGNGVTDPSAIRYFLNFALTQWQTAPQYVVLVGDGHFDYRKILSSSGKNYIIPYEYSGLSESASRATDDFYTYAIGNDTYMDISIGRINCRTTDELESYIQKIIQYETQPLYGLWKKTVTFVGDDEVTPYAINEYRHTNDAEAMANNYIPDYFDLKKIYLMEYPLEKSVGYDSKPKANEDLIDQINRGTVMINYVGHGNERVWAHESVFEKSRDLSLLYNARQLPLIYAATCAFGLYDNPDEQCFSEELVMADSTGAIAVISASRFCNALDNVALNKAFLNQLFSDLDQIMRVGDALRFAKAVSGTRSNNEMYHVFGDPALRLATPAMQAEITYTHPDSFKALSVFKVQGNVENQVDFEGRLILNAFDSKKNITYVTAADDPVNYLLPGNAIFRGEGTITNSQFDMTFVVPKDISYAGSTGRLSLYFWNASGDGVAWKDNIPVGGSADVVDTGEPTITIAFEDNENFISGDMIEENPVLVAAIADDKTGINLTGEIGHTLLLTLNNTTEKDVTEYFQYDENSYLQGKVVYPMQNLSQGQHTIKLKAWDNANNSSSQTVTFEIIPEGRLQLTDVLNYPNPFESETQFTFNLSHTSEIEIKVFTVSGRLIRKLDYLQGDSGFNMIHWDGRDELGDPLANGVYLFKVTAKTELNGESQKVSEIGRALLAR